jgi:hypothetical protein
METAQVQFSTASTEPTQRPETAGYEMPVDVKTAARFPWSESVAGVCLRQAKADSPFPNDGPLNSVQSVRTRKMAATILCEWRNR